jgi:GNAT superfamily N-acetyltransferase
MTVRIVTHAERPELQQRWTEAAYRVWPAFMLRDPVANAYWGGMARQYPECQFYVVDDDQDTFMGVGNSVPVAWDGTVAGLTAGVDDVLLAAVRDHATQPPATALCALQAGILPEFRRRGLSTVIIEAMRDIAAGRGLADLIAPVRPNQKSTYPLTPMERYIRWQRPDGLPQDAWLRVHARLGAEIMGVAEQSMDISGSVADWEEWTGMTFPDSGPYVVQGALVPVIIDRAADRGQYIEQNVWMRHRVSQSPA